MDGKGRRQRDRRVPRGRTRKTAGRGKSRGAGAGAGSGRAPHWKKKNPKKVVHGPDTIKGMKRPSATFAWLSLAHLLGLIVEEPEMVTVSESTHVKIILSDGVVHLVSDSTSEQKDAMIGCPSHSVRRLNWGFSADIRNYRAFNSVEAMTSTVGWMLAIMKHPSPSKMFGKTDGEYFDVSSFATWTDLKTDLFSGTITLDCTVDEFCKAAAVPFIKLGPVISSIGRDSLAMSACDKDYDGTDIPRYPSVLGAVPPPDGSCPVLGHETGPRMWYAVPPRSAGQGGPALFWIPKKSDDSFVSVTPWKTYSWTGLPHLWENLAAQDRDMISHLDHLHQWVIHDETTCWMRGNPHVRQCREMSVLSSIRSEILAAVGPRLPPFAPLWELVSRFKVSLVMHEKQMYWSYDADDNPQTFGLYPTSESVSSSLSVSEDHLDEFQLVHRLFKALCVMYSQYCEKSVLRHSRSGAVADLIQGIENVLNDEGVSLSPLVSERPDVESIWEVACMNVPVVVDTMPDSSPSTVASLSETLSDLTSSVIGPGLVSAVMHDRVTMMTGCTFVSDAVVSAVSALGSVTVSSIIPHPTEGLAYHRQGRDPIYAHCLSLTGLLGGNVGYDRTSFVGSLVGDEGPGSITTIHGRYNICRDGVVCFGSGVVMALLSDGVFDTLIDPALALPGAPQRQHDMLEVLVSDETLFFDPAALISIVGDESGYIFSFHWLTYKFVSLSEANLQTILSSMKENGYTVSSHGNRHFRLG